MDRRSIVCWECGEIMEVVKNGATVKLRDYIGYFRADIFKCPSCGNKVISGFSSEIIGELDRYDVDYTESEWL